MAFEFGGVDLSKTTTSKSISSLYCGQFKKATGEGHVLVLIDTLLSASALRALSMYLSKVFSNRKLDIVSLTNSKESAEEVASQGVLKFFKNKRKDSFLEYIIPEETIIITMGRALYGLNLALDVDVEDFYDNILGKTFYYSPVSGTHVFPVDSFDDLFILNPKTSSYRIQEAYKATFALSQFELLNSRYAELKSPPVAPRPTLIRVGSKEQASNLFKKYSTGCKVAWDLETSGFDFIEDRIGCVQLSFDGNVGYFIPWEFVDIDIFNKFLGNKQQIGQNLKFDCKFARQAGVSNALPWSDTMILGQTLGEYKSNGLKALAYYYTPYGGYDKELDDYIDMYHPATYLDIPEKILSKYATMDAIVNYLVHEKMQEQLTLVDNKFPPTEPNAKTLRYYYEKIRMPAYRTFIEIEMTGVYVDMKIWDEGSKDVMQRLLDLIDTLKNDLRIDEFLVAPVLDFAVSFGVEEEEEDLLFDNEYFKTLNSPSRLARLVEWLGWADYGRAKNGTYLTGDDALSRWDNDGCQGASSLKEFRSYRTLLKTFLGIPGSKEGWRKYIRYHPEDNSYRLHPSYRVMGAESGRNTCDSPNWQQIPSSSLGADLIKKIITVPNPEEYYLATLDYSSLQIRLAAIDSQDPYLCKIYREDPEADLHSVTAYEVFCKGREFEVEEFTFEDKGRTIVKFAHEKVKIIRGGKKMEMAAKDIVETDELDV